MAKAVPCQGDEGKAEAGTSTVGKAVACYPKDEGKAGTSTGTNTTAITIDTVYTRFVEFMA